MKKKYTLLITDGWDRIIESFPDDDMDVVVKQTAQYYAKKLENQLVFYTLMVDGKKDDQANWDMFKSKYNKYSNILHKIKSLNKDFEC